jgi:hypothetical protein
LRENIPFVGDATALYPTNRLHEAFNKGSTAAEAERRRRQAEKF